MFEYLKVCNRGGGGEGVTLYLYIVISPSMQRHDVAATLCDVFSALRAYTSMRFDKRTFYSPFYIFLINRFVLILMIYLPVPMDINWAVRNGR